MNIDYSSYQEVILENLKLDPVDWKFKNDPRYTQILEHVTYNIGYQYMDELQNRFNEIFTKHKEYLINICNENDSYGKTIKNSFDNFIICSPSNLRYILHSFLILDWAKKCSLNELNIIEIGGGYGGLSLFLHKLAYLFEINLKSYTIFDLPEALLLQKKYLELHNITIETFNIKDNFNLNKNSFLISNYAYSEINDEYRNLYTEKVLNPYTSHGFLTWNFIKIYNFIENKEIITEDEHPLTNPLNYYIYYKPK
jgi:hypothetical protein